MGHILSYNPVITVGFFGLFIAQIIKLIVSLVSSGRMDFRRLVDTGGMPSSHTSFVSSVTTSIGIIEGFHSTMFAVALCFSVIVVYDATNLRRSAGYHAQWLNRIVPDLLQGKIIKEKFDYKVLRELLGHNPIEVFVGGVLGVLIAVLTLYFLNIYP
ncbi:MAG: divergent PAP2 family protein [Planctomycetales bacterium]|nr:divergent PAP2 family protein [bacterium]UNM07416.1 MAG: divergent PAP2 family protein [Planctomycetales bacterium]